MNGAMCTHKLNIKAASLCLYSASDLFSEELELVSPCWDVGAAGMSVCPSMPRPTAQGMVQEGGDGNKLPSASSAVTEGMALGLLSLGG